MKLSDTLLRQFAKAVTVQPERKKTATVYGTVVEQEGESFVRLDGSEELTPVTLAAEVKNGERVTVMLQDHAAVATGNITSPSARVDTVRDLDNSLTQLDNSLTQQEIFDRLTNGGEEQGVYLFEGKLYINADYVDLNKLLAREATVTGNFQVNNNLWQLSASNEGLRLSLNSDDSAAQGGLYVSNGISGLSAFSNVFLSARSVTINGGTGISLIGPVTMDGDLNVTGTLTAGGKKIN